MANNERPGSPRTKSGGGRRHHRAPSHGSGDGTRDEWEDTAPQAKARGRRTPEAPSPTGSIAQREPAAWRFRRCPHARTLPPEIAAEIRNAAYVATALHRERLVERAESAYGAYEHGRYLDRAARHQARRRRGTERGCRARAGRVRRLPGGKWRDAVKHLEAHELLTDSAEHIPILMDCQRALHKPKKVADLWTKLRQSSPDRTCWPRAGSWPRRLWPTAGICRVPSPCSPSGGIESTAQPLNRHIRQWYLLADLYERAGDVPRARELFERVLRVDREAYDVAERWAALGPPTGLARAPAAARRPRPHQSPRPHRRPRRTEAPAGPRANEPGCPSAPGHGAHRGEERADRRQRPEHAGIGHRHFDAAVALGEIRTWPARSRAVRHRR